MRRFAGVMAGLLATASPGVLNAQDTLHVLWHVPGDTASPASTVTVMFDRPVAGALDSTVSAASVFRITPRVAGSVFWRDPISIRFIPSEPLSPGVRYTVGIDTTLRAVDSSRLGGESRFDFRVAGPRLLARSFDHYSYDRILAPNGRIQLLYSAPVDLDRLARGVRIELSGCSGGPAAQASVMFRPLGQHRLGPRDPASLQGAGSGDSISGRFRTVVELEPVSPLPLECAGLVVIPTTIDDAAFGSEERYSVRTAPVFRFLPQNCAQEPCSSDGTLIRFSSPVHRADVLKYVHLNDEPLLVGHVGDVAKQWLASVLLVARATYTVRIDSALRDIYDRPIEGSRTFRVLVDDHIPQMNYQRGTLTSPRSGPLSLPIKSVNTRSIRMIAYTVPDSVRIQVMSAVTNVTDPMAWLRKIVPETTTVVLPDRLNADTTTDVPVPPSVLAPAHPLVVFRIEIADSLPDVIPRSASKARHAVTLAWPEVYSGRYSPFTLLQVTDLAVSARLVAATTGSAFVSGLGDGRPRRGVTVSQFDVWRRLIGRGVTDERGVATLARVAPDSVPMQAPATPWPGPRSTVVQAETDDDRVTVALGGRAIGFQTGSPLQPNALGGRAGDSPLAAGAIFADRGIYRPGEVVYLKGVVRRGMLGALRLPSTSDSARITVRRNASWLEDTSVIVRDTTARLSSFGTLVDSVRLRPGLALDHYAADVRIVVDGKWRTVGSTTFRLAEYRAPNFLVDLSDDTTIHYAGDTIAVEAKGQLLFGAPLRGGQLRWTARIYEGGQPRPNGIEDDWSVGDQLWWRGTGQSSWGKPALSGVATLDANGRARIRVPVAALMPQQSGSVNVSVGVTDVDQQVVTEQTSATVSSSRTYILARVPKRDSAWRIGKPARVQLRTVDEGGALIRGVVLRAVTLWRHTKPGDPYTNTPSVQRTDTVGDRRLTLDDGEAFYSFVPDSGGEYAVVLSAHDSHGGPAITTIVRAVAGPSVPRVPVLVRAPPGGFRLAMTADSTRLAVGAVAHVHFDSPFRDAEAWITMEREGIIEERRQRASRGDNVVDVPIRADFEPNVFVSIVLFARDGRARPDSAKERLRAGYLELNVSSNRHALSVAVATDRKSYLPRDSAAIRVRVRDATGKGVRAEVSVWAVDEGVLALTGFTTPDVRSRIYAARGINNVLWSTLPTLVTNDPMLAVMFLQQSIVALNEVVMTSVGASVSTVSAVAPTVRSHFASTAFYLGRVETDEQGNAVAHTAVPDNLTTFRVMAVAASAGDQYGRGDTTLLVTRPLVARAALPRFVRASDSLVAGVVITARDGRPRQATTEASVVGAALRGPTTLSVALTRTASSETRFIIQTPKRDQIGDTITVQLGASDGTSADATETRIPVRPDFHPRTHATLGAVRDSQTLAMTLPPDIDPARSRLRLRIGTSRTSAMLAAYRWLRAYPYDCSEQLSSVGRALIAVWKATKGERPDALGGDPHEKLQQLVDEISKRQAANGSIKYWPTWDWSSPWLSSYAGTFLIEARDVGVKVDPTVVRRIGEYLADYARLPVDTGGMNRYEQQARRLALGGRVAIVDFLRRAQMPDTGAERALLRVAGVMTWEDRLRLAEVIAVRKDMRADAEAIVDAAWRTVTPAGHRVDLPDSSHAPREFFSRIAPAARLLSASLELRPTQPLLGGLMETVLQQGRAESRFAWNTQDYASVVMALAQYRENDSADRIVTAHAGGSRFVAHPPKGDVDTTITAPLTGMLETAPNGEQVLRVHVDASSGERPVYYAIEVDEVPVAAPVKPDIHGIVVERWYERFDNGAAVTHVNEGDLVRVRLRVTIPADREFVALEDPLPAGLEPIDLGLRTTSLSPFVTPESDRSRAIGDRDGDGPFWQAMLYGGWDNGHWSPWEHKELHDDRVSYFARMLWTGSYTASYVARATTAGSFVAPPAYAEEMYNPALQGRSSGGRFLIDVRP